MKPSNKALCGHAVDIYLQLSVESGESCCIKMCSLWPPSYSRCQDQMLRPMSCRVGMRVLWLLCDVYSCCSIVWDCRARVQWLLCDVYSCCRVSKQIWKTDIISDPVAFTLDMLSCQEVLALICMQRVSECSKTNISCSWLKVQKTLPWGTL